VKAVIALVCLGSVAHADPSWVAATITATSTLDASHGPANAVDEEAPLTGWCAQKGDGIGEGLTIDLESPAAFDRITIYVGSYPSRHAWGEGRPSSKWNRPRQLAVRLDDAVPVNLDVKDGVVEVPTPSPIHHIEISFLAVKKCKKRASCIAGIDFGDKTQLAFTTDAKSLDHLSGDFAALVAAVKTCAPDALGKQVAAELDESTTKDGGDTYKHHRVSGALDDDGCAMLQGDVTDLASVAPRPIGLDRVVYAGETTNEPAWVLGWDGTTWRLVERREDDTSYE